MNARLRDCNNSFAWPELCAILTAVCFQLHDGAAQGESMRSRITFVVTMCALLGFAALHAASHQKADRTIPERWSEKAANDWYARQPWLIGSNYIPATAINELEMWQADTFD